MMKLTSNLLARLKRVRKLRYDAAASDLAQTLERNKTADSRCVEAFQASEAASANAQTLPDLALLGEARMKRLKAATELKGALRTASGLTAKAKAEHDRVSEIELANRSHTELLRDRADELEAQEFFACKR